MGIILMPLFILVCILSLELFRTINNYNGNDKGLLSILGVLVGIITFFLKSFSLTSGFSRVNAFQTVFSTFFIVIPLLLLIIIFSFIKADIFKKINYFLSVSVLIFFLFSFFLSSFIYDFLGVKIIY